MTGVTSQTSSPDADHLEAGRAAIQRHEWRAAYEHLTAADIAGDLRAGTDYEALAEAAFFAGEHAGADDAREHAFTAHLDAGDSLRAAYTAIGIARMAAASGRSSIASGWVQRGERILEPGGDTYAHGYLALVRSEIAGSTGDMDRAVDLAEQAIAIANRGEDRDLRAWALANLGELRIAGGHTPDGIALLEEASIAAVNGELSPITSGVTACRMISACRALSDYRRASEWIEATERYCQRQSLSGFPGVCRVHRAEVAAMGGAWEQAELDLVQATIELETFQATSPQADGCYALGDLRRHRGDFEGAEASLREAHAMGRSPQPALALIRLAQGKVKAAVSAIEAAVADETSNRWTRARLLPARIEILVAAGDIVAARDALMELASTVEEYPSPALVAGRHAAAGRVHLAEGDAAGAARELRAAIRGWREVGAPYEVARARQLLATALRTLDDEDGAYLELGAALDEFRRLGAAVDIERAERLMAEAEDRRRAPEQVRRAFMFTDIVGSTTLAEALGDTAWERLLRWHDETLRRIIAGGGGEVVNSTGDGFFAAFDSARRAIDCATAIQRALRDHQEAVGFVPPIRIGIHVADANRRGMDYGGIGVHVAARVGALAGSGEILATVETLQEAGETPATEPRSVTVKGVSVPLLVAPVSWA